MLELALLDWSRRMVFSSVAMGALLLMPATANATPNFPPEIQAHEHITCTWMESCSGAPSSSPPCTICHQDCKGGLGTATKPFAMTMRSLGLLPFQTSLLDHALDQDMQKHISSAGDGTSDIERLQSCRDPNGASTEGPKYGCGGGQVAGVPGGVPRGEAACVAVLVAIVLSARRRAVNGHRTTTGSGSLQSRTPRRTTAPQRNQ